MTDKLRFCTKQADHDYEKRQNEGLERERLEREQLLARFEQIRKEFKALVDPEISRRLQK